MTNKPVLIRDFIYKSLYGPNLGYFTRPENIQLGRLKKPLIF